MRRQWRSPRVRCGRVQLRPRPRSPSLLLRAIALLRIGLRYLRRRCDRARRPPMLPHRWPSRKRARLLVRVRRVLRLCHQSHSPPPPPPPPPAPLLRLRLLLLCQPLLLPLFLLVFMPHPIAQPGPPRQPLLSRSRCRRPSHLCRRPSPRFVFTHPPCRPSRWPACPPAEEQEVVVVVVVAPRALASAPSLPPQATHLWRLRVAALVLVWAPATGQSFISRSPTHCRMRQRCAPRQCRASAPRCVYTHR
mmetsp:Transcript_7822/g.24152  ORF Transcript_7822/g.24152 Transcript_7822/m.24152 type:complete len:249 (+) Transcript_7822:525-1271(+)